MALNVFQKVYIKPENTFLGGDSDFSSGIKIKPLEKIKIEGITKAMVDNPTVREGWEDVGGAPVEGLQEAKFDVSVLFSGASLSSGAVQSDALSTLLEAVIGAKNTVGNGTVGDGTNTSTTTTVYTNDSFSAGDIIIINGEVRRIESVSGTALNLDIPLSQAPSDGDTIYGTEYYSITPSGTRSLAIGIETEDSELRYLVTGAVPIGGLTVDAKLNDFVRFNMSMEGAQWSRGVTITPATDATPDAGVMVGDHGEVAIGTASGLVRLHPSDLNISLGLAYEWIPSIIGTNGKGGFEPVPAESTIEITAYQDGTLGTLEGLVETTFPLMVQIGATRGKIVGIYYPEATIATYPTGADIGSIQGVKVGFKTSAGILFRG